MRTVLLLCLFGGVAASLVGAFLLTPPAALLLGGLELAGFSLFVDDGG